MLLEIIGVVLATLGLAWAIGTYLNDRLDKRFLTLHDDIKEASLKSELGNRNVSTEVVKLKDNVQEVRLIVVKFKSDLSAQNHSLQAILKNFEQRLENHEEKIEEHENQLNDFSKVMYIRGRNPQ